MRAHVVFLLFALILVGVTAAPFDNYDGKDGYAAMPEMSNTEMKELQRHNENLELIE
ncbi:hypothetical protein GBF38_002647, partial [Nibea albiflora]